jgi:hypothetical protein
MTGDSLHCPNPQCGCPVHPGDAFCPHCGQSLAATGNEPPASAPAPEASPAGNATRIEPPRQEASLSESLQPFLSELPPAVRGESDGAFEPAAPLSQAGDAGSASGLAGQLPSDCHDLDVRYNNSCVFVLNMQSTFDFGIRPLVDGLRDFFVEIRQSGQVIAREAPRVLLRRGAPLSFGLNYTPRNTHAGKVSFEILVGFRKDGRLHVYAAYRNHTIYSGKEDPRQVCESLVVEVKNNIQQGHAGDLRVDQNFNGLREALRDRNSIALDREFLQLINTRPFWSALPLAECSSDGLSGPASAPETKNLRHLELRATEGLSVHLLRTSAIRIGRRRDCEVLARVVDAGGRELPEESLRISQYHALLEWRGEQCLLRDGGQYQEKGWRASAAGVWVDGKRLPSNGEFTFLPGREYQIALRDPADGHPHRYELSARLWSVRDMPELRPACPDAGLSPTAPACLVLRRLQGPRWIYLALRTCAAMAWADSRCGRGCVCVRDDGLQFSDGHLCEPLAPGRPLRAGGMTFQVSEPTPLEEQGRKR